MLRLKLISLTIVMVASQLCATPTAEAGPLLDWWRNLRRRNTCFRPTTYQTTAAVNPYNLQPGQCARTCNQTCSRVVVNYVPYTAYRTNWKRVAQTQYRPETNTDPCTGCTVTCMKPCTTYRWQMQRVPYTTYRPVYRQENYTVPVTTITNDCATGTCGTCQTCPTGTYPYPGTGALPQNSVVVPNNTLGTSGGFQPTPVNDGIPSFNQGTGADAVPAIDNVNPQSNQRAIIDRIETQPLDDGSTTRNVPRRLVPQNTAPQNNNIYPINNQRPSPAVINYDNQTAMSPIKKKWSYTVRLASYTKDSDSSPDVIQTSRRGPTQIQGTFEPVTRQRRSNTKAADNSAWKTVEW